MTGFLRAQEATVFDQNAVNAAKRSAEIAMAQYREGAVDYQRVLDAQRSLLQENNLAQTHSSIATNLIALYKALGGGWELRQGQPFVAESTQDRDAKTDQLGQVVTVAAGTGNLNPPPPASDIPLFAKTRLVTTFKMDAA